jgi:hypothetical protein
LKSLKGKAIAVYYHLNYQASAMYPLTRLFMGQVV